MKQYIETKCRHCGAEDLVKNGLSENGTQRYRCNKCRKSFQHDYTYNAWKPGVKEQIEIQTLNSGGVRDISRTLDISKNTVFRAEKKNPAEVNPHFAARLSGLPPYELEIEIRIEADEFWSYVGNKKNQRWTSLERNSGVVIAWHNGRRTDESCSCLMEKISVFPAARFYTDDWKSYRKYIPPSKHVMGKSDTWRIERRNLNFRTHIKRLSRRTICFSKNEKIHDNVIGMYINRYYFESGRYSAIT